MAGLRLLQINGQRARLVMSQLRKVLCDEDIDILLLQEPYCFKGEIAGFSGLRIMKSDDEECMASIVVCNPDISVTMIASLATSHGVCVAVDWNGTTTYLVSLYCQASHPIQEYLDYIERVNNMFGNQRLVFAMDSNAKSTLWYEDTTDDKGRDLVELIAQTRLACINLPERLKTFSSSNGESNIDLTLASASVDRDIANWEVHESWTTSDHRAITFDIRKGAEASGQDYVSRRYNIKKMNWELYDDFVRRRLNRNGRADINRLNAEDQAKSLQEIMLGACQIAAPPKRKIPLCVPWWNAELTTLRRETIAARKDYQKARRERWSENDLTTQKEFMKRKMNIYKTAIHRAKLDSWKRFIQEQGNRDPWKTVYKIVTRKSNTGDVISSVNVDGVETTNWKETVTAILDSLIVSSNDNDLSEEQLVIAAENDRYTSEEEEVAFTPEELETAVKKMKLNRTPGGDLIEPEVVKRLWQVKPRVLLGVMNTCLRDKTFPNIWKPGEIKILRKPDRPPGEVKAYRPITLLPVMGKLYERLIVERIMIMNERSGEMAEGQYGFRKGKSTVDAVVKLQETVRENDDKYALGIFIDISGAFDNMWWQSVFRSLRKSHVSTSLYEIIKEYFRERKVTVRSRHDSISKVLTRGCPQGSVIGPVAWNLVFDEMINMQIEGVTQIAYADDLALVVRGNSRAELERRADNALITVNRWVKLHRMELAVNKTKIMMLKGKLSSNRRPSVRVGASPVSYAASLKYLGIILDDRGSFVPHMVHIRDKVTRLCAQIARIARKDWGLGSHAMNILYEGVFVPIITYGAPVWVPKIGTPPVCRKIISMQRFVLLSMTRACRTVSNDALQVLAGRMPMDLAAIEKALTYWASKKISKEEMGVRSLSENEQPLVVERRRIRQNLIDIWQSKWDASTKGRITNVWMPNVNPFLHKTSPWFRPGLRLTYLITGHGSLNGKLYELGIVEEANCTCGEIETAEHILMSCELYTDLRGRLMNTLEIDEMRMLNWEDLAVDRDIYKTLSEFAEETFEYRKTVLRI